MKYIIDTDALRECMKLLSEADTGWTKGEYGCVYLQDVIDMIDRFPKDEVKGHDAALRPISITSNDSTGLPPGLRMYP